MTSFGFTPALFQTFEVKSDTATVAPRLAALRAELKAAELDAFLVPRADAHRGESVPPGEARLGYVTGFTGSAGIAIIGRHRAGLFVDSRYTLQAPAQTDTALVTIFELGPKSVAGEIATFVPAGGRLGYDPWLHTPGEIAELTKSLDGRANLVATENLVDRIWTDRPRAPVSQIDFLDDDRSGKSTEAKLTELQQTLLTERADAVVLSLPESICWLLNMRGRDVPNTPFVLGFAIVSSDAMPTLFLDSGKITPELVVALGDIAIVSDAKMLLTALASLGEQGKTVWIDPATVPVAIADALTDAGAELVEKRDPILLPKSRKNAVELAGMSEAHRLDGVALAKFLHWFYGEAPSGQLTEIDIVTALEAFRREDQSLVDISFDTISGAGPNGAIVHYRVTEATNRTLAPDELMLLDSGGQYLSGTTDITRTMAVSEPTPEQMDRYTRVLKGMIAVSSVRFPKGTSGAQIDILARQFLWQVGQTYSHGTGHGVGAFLGVHEGPIGISSRYTLPLEPGMVVSNEPGFYKTGEYGIRIENLLAAVESPFGSNFIEFETLTLVPIDRTLIALDLLTAPERDWLDTYHRRVCDEISPLVSGAVKDWLIEATRPL